MERERERELCLAFLAFLAMIAFLAFIAEAMRSRILPLCHRYQTLWRKNPIAEVSTGLRSRLTAVNAMNAMNAMMIRKKRHTARMHGAKSEGGLFSDCD